MTSIFTKTTDYVIIKKQFLTLRSTSSLPRKLRQDITVSKLILECYSYCVTWISKTIIVKTLYSKTVVPTPLSSQFSIAAAAVADVDILLVLKYN